MSQGGGRAVEGLSVPIDPHAVAGTSICHVMNPFSNRMHRTKRLHIPGLGPRSRDLASDPNCWQRAARIALCALTIPDRKHL